MKKIRKIKNLKAYISVFSAVAILIASLTTAIAINAGAASSIPDRPEENLNYADLISGISLGSYWTEQYYRVSYAPLTFKMRVGADMMQFVGSSPKGDYVIKTDVTLPEDSSALCDVRLLINGSKSAKNIQLILSKTGCDLYYAKAANLEPSYFAHGNHSAFDDGKVSIAVAKKDEKISVWLDGTAVITDAEIDSAYIGLEYGLGVSINSNWLGGDSSGDWSTEHPYVLFDNFDVYNIEEDFIVPSMPDGNKNYAENITGFYERYIGTASTTVKYSGGTAKYIKGKGYPIAFKGIDFVDDDYVVKFKLKTPSTALNSNGSIAIIIGADDDVKNAIVFHIQSNKVVAKQLVNDVETEIAWVSRTRSKGITEELIFHIEKGGKITVWFGGKALIWTDSKSGATETAVSGTTYGSRFGVYMSNLGNTVSSSKAVTVSDISAYDTVSVKTLVERTIAAIPEITYRNYLSVEATEVKKAESAVDEYLNYADGNKTSDISNYALLEKAKAEIANWKSNADMVAAIIAVEDAINNIPNVIDENNCQTALNGSIKDAEAAVERLKADYPDFDVTQISDYNKIAISKSIAENGGIYDNLFYGATGVSFLEGATGNWDKFNNSLKITTPEGVGGWAQFNDLTVDTSKTYKLSATVTFNSRSQIEGETRIAFKGSSYLDYIYLRFNESAGEDAITVYDPVERIERNLIAKTPFKREVGVAYKIDIITGNGFMKLLINDEVIMSLVDISYAGSYAAGNQSREPSEYTGNFIFFSAYNSDGPTDLEFKNISLEYYDAQQLTPTDNESDTNLLNFATAFSGNETNSSFFGSYNRDTNTSTIVSSGIGGQFVGVKPDASKAYVLNGKISTTDKGGSLCFAFDGNRDTDHIIVTLAESEIAVNSIEFGEIAENCVSERFNLEAGKKYDATVLREGNKVSVFVDGKCYIRDAEIDAAYENGYVAAYTLGNGGTAEFADLKLYYPDVETLAELTALKDTYVGDEEEQPADDDSTDIPPAEETPVEDTSVSNTNTNTNVGIDGDTSTGGYTVGGSTETNNGNGSASPKRVLVREYDLWNIPAWFIVLVSLGAAALVGGGVFLIIFLKKKRKSKATAE